MELIGILILVFFGFIFFGLLGWILKIFGYVLEFLWEGFENSLGCLFWVIVIILFIICVGS